MSSEPNFLHELKVVIEAEVVMIEESRPEEAAATPVTDWLFDPLEARREQIGLRGLHDAVEALEHDVRPGDHAD
ncbi:hypothetical protein [Nonomuraea sp. NPDC023979]|uniref:hypothetical protein n=1 Tax=Nonomuraea sp. NPDC023979 TaxID=3154796 RepID=UPI0033DD6263